MSVDGSEVLTVNSLQKQKWHAVICLMMGSESQPQVLTTDASERYSDIKSELGSPS